MQADAAVRDDWLSAKTIEIISSELPFFKTQALKFLVRKVCLHIMVPQPHIWHTLTSFLAIFKPNLWVQYSSEQISVVGSAKQKISFANH